MRARLGFVALAAVAVVVGVASARPAALWAARSLAVHDGAWVTFAGTGSAHANPYTRAAVALAGLYALTPREAIYYTAFNDSAGRLLRGQCDYHIDGNTLPAGWWSVTLYGPDNYLVANPAGRYSWNGHDLGAGRDRRGGGFRILVSARRQAGDWLPAPEQGPYSLTLRLYRPDAVVRTQPAAVVLPSIERERCR